MAEIDHICHGIKQSIRSYNNPVDPAREEIGAKRIPYRDKGRRAVIGQQSSGNRCTHTYIVDHQRALHVPGIKDNCAPWVKAPLGHDSHMGCGKTLNSVTEHAPHGVTGQSRGSNGHCHIFPFRPTDLSPQNSVRVDRIKRGIRVTIAASAINRYRRTTGRAGRIPRNPRLQVIKAVPLNRRGAVTKTQRWTRGLGSWAFTARALHEVGARLQGSTGTALNSQKGLGRTARSR